MSEHPLSPTQIAKVHDLIRQIETTKTTLNWFLTYIVEEAKLPPINGGYQLSPDGTKLIAPVTPSAASEDKQ